MPQVTADADDAVLVSAACRHWWFRSSPSRPFTSVL
jgi:hypothetical protein